MVQLHIDDGCGWMDEHRVVELSGVMVTSMAKDLLRLTHQSALKMDQWKMAATTHVSASDRFVPRTRYVSVGASGFRC